MTRFLSQVLGAVEPKFSQSIQELEQAAGRPSADIRLTADLTTRLRTKITELGLDPKDTTGPELYQALQTKLRNDETQVRTALGISETAPPDTVMSRIQMFVENRDMPKSCFALKASVAKRLLKKKPPKTVMKKLHYRSVDSMLKQEHVAHLYAAASMVEPANWHKAFRDQYAKLRSSDFEMRNITVLHPTSKHWQELAASYVKTTHHNVLTFKELGSIVLLPIDAPLDGVGITNLLLVFADMNNIRAYSSYAKLQQVKPDFGSIVQATSQIEPYTSAQLGGRAVPWSTIHRYYAHNKYAYHPEVFEPHVQPEDLTWLRGEAVLAGLGPTLSFWVGTESLGLLHNGEPVSCNVFDVALGYVNHLSFEDRVVHFVRDNVWHELMLRYLHEHNLEDAVHKQLAQDLSSVDLSLPDNAVNV